MIPAVSINNCQSGEVRIGEPWQLTNDDGLSENETKFLFQLKAEWSRKRNFECEKTITLFRLIQTKI